MRRVSRISAAICETMITLYGIGNCDTVKKARRWLESHTVAYTYHDFRIDGLTSQTLREWAQRIGWESLLNRRSRSWKELSESERREIDEAKALRLMLANPTLIKRPVVTDGERVFTGFSEDEFDVLFGKTNSSATQGL